MSLTATRKSLCYKALLVKFWSMDPKPEANLHASYNIKSQTLSPLLIQNLNFYKIPKLFVCSLTFGKHSVEQCVLCGCICIL